MKLDNLQCNIIYDLYKNIKNLDITLYRDDSLSTGRSIYQRDYAQVLYSSSFRRLQGKTQFLGISSDKFFRNRLTHSLEVSQIAVGIAQKLNFHINEKIGKTLYDMEDIFVLQIASLAHNLGHSAFGHNGEKVCKIVDFLIDDISLVPLTKEKRKLFGNFSQLQLGFKDYYYLALGLKEIVFKCLQRDQRVKEYRAKGDLVLEKLFYFYQSNPNLMSLEYSEEFSNLPSSMEEERNRVIIDYLSGMMDPFAFSEYEKYFGKIYLGKK